MILTGKQSPVAGATPSDRTEAMVCHAMVSLVIIVAQSGRTVKAAGRVT